LALFFLFSFGWHRGLFGRRLDAGNIYTSSYRSNLTLHLVTSAASSSGRAPEENSEASHPHLFFLVGNFDLITIFSLLIVPGLFRHSRLLSHYL
jgi:hypothetical protein